MAQIVVIGDSFTRTVREIARTTLREAFSASHILRTRFDRIAVVPAAVEGPLHVSFEAVLALPGVREIDPRNLDIALSALFGPGEPLGTIVALRAPPLPFRKKDIGVFVNTSSAVNDGSDWLRDTSIEFPKLAHADSAAGVFRIDDQRVVVDAITCGQLRAALDAAFTAAPNTDLKLPLHAVAVMLTPDTQAVLNAAVHGATQWVLRRTVATGAWIPFHTDVAAETVQVPLQDDVDGAGGQLVFVQSRKPVFARRRAGIPMYHEGTALHGVTAFTSGVRYALYVLRTDAEF